MRDNSTAAEKADLIRFWTSEIMRAHGLSEADARYYLIKTGFTRINALTRYAQNEGDKSRPAPGRKVRKAKAKAKAKATAAPDAE